MSSGSSPTVSVVVPTYNGAPFVERCLRSLVAQSNETVEVIVVDDGSSDDTPAIVARTRDVVFVRGEHRGVAVTRNVGIARAGAPLIGFCDQDDEWLPDKAHRQAEYLRMRPDVAAVLARAQVVFDDVERPAWLVDDHRGDPGGVPSLSGLFRAEVFAEVGDFVDSPLGNDDFDLLVRMREHALAIDVLDDILVRRHIHDANASHRLGSYEKGALDVLRRRVQRTRQ